MFREVDYPYIQLSEGLYHWRVSFGAVLEAWTPKEHQGQDTPGPYGTGNKEDYMDGRHKGKVTYLSTAVSRTDQTSASCSFGCLYCNC